jgi:hypothetical protein
MSLLAGFDFVSEISNETILKLIRTNFELGGISADPPFEITIPITGGSAHLVLTGLNLDLNADDTATLTYDFDRGSVEIASPVKLAVCPLAGSIAIQASISLQDGDNQTKSLAFAVTGAAITYTAAADQAIASSLAGKPITPAVFKTYANQAVTTFVQSAAPPDFGVSFKVVPGANGALAPKLVFERLEVHCIANPSRSKQALALFGILLKANNAHGDHTKKTATAITAADDGFGAHEN